MHLHPTAKGVYQVRTVYSGDSLYLPSAASLAVIVLRVPAAYRSAGTRVTSRVTIGADGGRRRQPRRRTPLKCRNGSGLTSTAACVDGHCDLPILCNRARAL